MTDLDTSFDDMFLPDMIDESPDLSDPESLTVVMREIRSKSAKIAAIKESFAVEIARMQALEADRISSLQERVDHLKDHLRRYMTDQDVKKIDTAIGLVNLKPGAVSVNLADDIEAVVEYLEAYAPETVCTVPKIDKGQVKKALQEDRIPSNAYVYTTVGDPILAFKFHA